MCGAAALWQAHRHRVRLAEVASAVRAKAEQGDAKAEVRLGSMYYYGEGEPRDYGEAMRWARKAADQGNAWAEYDIGAFYESGKGVPQDDAAAARWYRKAAEQGEARAEVALGTMYFYGQGVTEDREVAAAWYRKAAEKGLARAQYDLSYAYAHGQGVPQDQAEADRWLHKAAAQGDKNAEQELGLRGNGLSTWSAVTLAALVLWCFWILKGASSLSGEIRERQRLVLILAGAVGVICAALKLYRAYGVFPSLLVADIAYFVELAFCGVFAVLLVFVLHPAVKPKTAKIVLGAVGACVVLFNILAVRFVLAHRGTWPDIRAQRGFAGLNGLLVGVAILLVILLWRGGDRRGDPSGGVADGEVG